LFPSGIRLQHGNSRSASFERQALGKGADKGAIIGEVPLVVPSENGRTGTKGNDF